MDWVPRVTRMVRTILAVVGVLAPSALMAQRTDNPHGLSVQGTCAACHRAEGWKPAAIARDFRHAPRTFPLDGAHAKATCTSCHASLDFSQAPTACASCHQDVHKGEFGTQCARCHTARTFTDRAQMAQVHQSGRFPLTGGHATVACESCHPPARNGQLQFVNRPVTCIGCHAGTMRAVKSPDHVAASFSQDCTSCHSRQSWDNASYDHSRTKFPLTLGHAGRTCESCHADKVYHGKPMTCVSCHARDYQRATTPPHTNAFPTGCADCHTTAEWKGARFDHDLTQFPLLGAHKATTCAECHADQVFKGKPTACISCHQSDFNGTVAPKHPAAGFSTTCLSCHSMNGWKGGTFDHNVTRFALTGAHRTATCLDCHGDNVYVGTPMACASCHQARYDATTNPPHLKTGFSTGCSNCHGTNQWNGAVFDHSRTRFQLTNGHVGRLCNDCHADGVYAGRPTACVSCHQDDYDATASLPHAKAGFPTTCESCHSTVKWPGGAFSHATTRFPLTGAHLTATCSSCHGDGVYRGKPTTCLSCHGPDFTAAKNPPHAALGFPGTCETCHTTSAWTGATFDHNRTAFSLTGAHLVAQCGDCHGNGVFKGTPTACASCHQREYAATTAPPHAAAGFPTLCASCHTTATWNGGKFDHNATAFPLAGAHAAATCASCHGDGVYKGKPTTCVSCHLADYNATTKPRHSSSGFGTTCQTCHTGTTTWLGAVFNHGATLFPLTGAHLATPCLDCHGDGVYKGKPTACASCHQGAYNGTTNPHHAAAGFTTLCASCHTTTRWPGAPYDHSRTLFPLTGRHVTATCIDCHADKVYKGKPTLCVSCHQSEYNNTTSPKHSTAGFPTTCQSCHTTTQWLGATFNHDGPWFPIYSGTHKGKWSACADCHQQPTNYKQFECILCHEHSNKTKVDSDHKGEAGYQYKSSACYACHPRGN